MASPPGASLPFVGRQAAVDHLRAALASPGSLAVVEGAGGMGKTRLGAAVAAGAFDDGLDVLYAACTRAEGLGSSPIPDLLVTAIERLPPAVALELLPAVARLVPMVADLTAATVGADGDTEVDGETRRLQLVGVVERVLTEATGSSTLIVVDDVQWLEPAGERFLLHLVDRLPAVRWLFLIRPAGRTEAAVSFLGSLGRRPAEWLMLESLRSADVRELVAGVARPEDVDAWHDLLMARSGGLPFVAQALLRHLVSGGDPSLLPRGLTHVVHADLAHLGPEARLAAELLAVAGGRESVPVLADAAALSRRRATDAADELVAAGLAVAGPAIGTAVGVVPNSAPAAKATDEPTLVLAHDLITETVLVDLTDDRRRAHNRALGRALTVAGGAHVRALSHLLAGGDEVDVAELDAVAGDALRLLNLQTAFERAQVLGEAYLARAGEVATSVPGLEARVQVATALLAMGETSRGLAVHADLLPQVRASQDARLLTDLVLARGPVDTGGADPGERVREARVLLELLPAEERTRRIQLAAWAAHNLLVVGEVDEARQLLADAQDLLDAPAADGTRPVGPVVRGIVAGVAYQATTTADAEPARSRQAYQDLLDLDAQSGLASVAATRRLFAVDQAMRFAGTPELRAAIDEMAAHLSEFPRPDLRWWVVAAESAYAHLCGDLVTAEVELMRAAEVGAQLSVAPAGSVALLQRLMLQWELGTLADLHPMMGQVLRPDPSPIELAMTVLVCTEAGDLAGAAAAGGRLLEVPRFLVASGPSWPAVATIAAYASLEADLPDLADRVAGDLAPHRGTGLSVSGLAHFGPCDRLLGLLDAARGELDSAIERAEAALEESRAKALGIWVAHTAANVADLRERRGRPGDLQEADRLRADAQARRAGFRFPPR